MTKEELAKVFIAAGEATKSVTNAKNKKSVFKNVKVFQKLDGNLKVDGQWGINTRTAAAWYLQDENIVPPPAFPSGKLSWQPPIVDDSTPATPKQREEVVLSRTSVTHGKKPSLSKVKKASKSPFVSPLVSQPEMTTVLAAEQPAYGQGIPQVNSGIDVEQQIISYLNTNVNPKIDAITQLLAKNQLQKVATGEHKKIVKDDSFKNKLLSDIAIIKDKLVNAKAATLDRKVIAALLM